MSAFPPVDNPVTASLLSRLEDKPLHTFVASWDSLEQLAVAAYRDQQHDLAREAQYRKLRGGCLMPIHAGKARSGWHLKPSPRRHRSGNQTPSRAF